MCPGTFDDSWDALWFLQGLYLVRCLMLAVIQLCSCCRAPLESLPDACCQSALLVLSRPLHSLPAACHRAALHVLCCAQAVSACCLPPTSSARAVARPQSVCVLLAIEQLCSCSRAPHRIGVFDPVGFHRILEFDSGPSAGWQHLCGGPPGLLGPVLAADACAQHCAVQHLWHSAPRVGHGRCFQKHCHALLLQQP